MSKTGLFLLSVLSAGTVVLNVGCMRCGEKAMERIAERSIERAAGKSAGGKADIDLGSSVDISGLPEQFRYAGATPKGRWTMTNDKGTGAVYVLESADPVKTVVEFYKRALAGWTNRQTMESDETTVLAATSSDEKTSVTVTIAPSEGKTGINILHVTK
jgi:hypothetical protein